MTIIVILRNINKCDIYNFEQLTVKQSWYVCKMQNCTRHKYTFAKCRSDCRISLTDHRSQSVPLSNSVFRIIQRLASNKMYFCFTYLWQIIDFEWWHLTTEHFFKSKTTLGAKYLTAMQAQKTFGIKTSYGSKYLTA